MVRGEANPLTGNIVVATVRLSTDEDLPAFRKRLRAFCRDRLSRFMVPQKVEIAEADLHGERFKRMRLAK